MAESRNSARRIAHRLKRKRAVELRLKGLKYREIAEELETSTLYAWTLVDKELEWVASKRQEKGGKLAQLELDRCDQLQAALWTRAMEGNEKAVLAVLKIMDRRAKLTGIDKATKVELAARPYDTMSQEELEAEAVRRGLPVPGVKMIETSGGTNGGVPQDTQPFQEGATGQQAAVVRELQPA